MDTIEKHAASPNPLMLVDFESMLAKSKRDHLIWTALSAAIFTLIVIAWPVAQGPLDTPTEIVLLFVRGLMPGVLCLGILLALVAIHLRMEALLQRRLNDYTTAEIIAIIGEVRSGDAKKLGADLLWLRAAFGTDHQAWTFLAGDHWQGSPPSQPISYDELVAERPRSRVRYLTIVLLTTGLCMMGTLLPKTFEFAATHGSSVRLSTSAALGLQALGFLSVVALTAYLFFEAHLEHQEGKKAIPQLVESWLNGSERAGKALRRRARFHPELHEIAERCGWQVKRSG